MTLSGAYRLETHADEKENKSGERNSEKLALEGGSSTFCCSALHLIIHIELAANLSFNS